MAFSYTGHNIRSSYANFPNKVIDIKPPHDVRKSYRQDASKKTFSHKESKTLHDPSYNLIYNS